MVDEALHVCDVSQNHENWLSDSSASHHMSQHINLFTSYQDVNGSYAFMSNVVSCQIFGVGNVRIKMYDDTTRTLIDVRHVPELRNNFISLEVLDLEGYKFTCQNGVLKVSKGTLVIMKVEKIINIYRLKRST